ncbi:MAG: cell division protein ZapA [Alicyclobacillus sp.]|nr:cell division protein ZapA [Alicyclobacillus sp.]
MGTEGHHRVRIVIGGVEYTVRGPVPAEHLRAVAELVNGVMQQVATAHPALDARRVAVLTALNLADELYRLRKEYQELMELLDEKTQVDPPERRGGD